MVRPVFSKSWTMNTEETVSEKAARLALGARTGAAEGEAALDAWLAEDDAHIEAYADALLVWEQLGQVAPDWPSEHLRGQVTRRRLLAGALSLVVGGLFGVTGWKTFRADYVTGIGEQRLVRLEDGTRVVLNTNSAIKLHYEKNIRRVRLLRGEALFDVAHDTARPFVVEASDKYVRAVGTSFVVRADKDMVEVILLSGRVDIGENGGNKPKRLSLKPGDRLRETGEGQMLDRPVIDAVTAWRKGQIILDGVPLDRAVAEMNRYTRKPIVVKGYPEGPQKLSGVVRIDEPEVFVATVARVYGLRLETTPDAYVLGQETRR